VTEVNLFALVLENDPVFAKHLSHEPFTVAAISLANRWNGLHIVRTLREPVWQNLESTQIALEYSIVNVHASAKFAYRPKR